MGVVVSWLQANNGAIIAVASTLYAVFTVFLWLATKRQAKITQRMFEASQRPWVSITVPSPTRDDRRIQWDFWLENKGTVPAVLTAWHVSVSQRGKKIIERLESGVEIILAVFPGTQDKMRPVEIRDEPVLAAQRGEATSVEAVVRDRELGETAYSTRVVYELVLTVERTIWEWREIRLDV